MFFFFFFFLIFLGLLRSFQNRPTNAQQNHLRVYHSSIIRQLPSVKEVHGLGQPGQILGELFDLKRSSSKMYVENIILSVTTIQQIWALLRICWALLLFFPNGLIHRPSMDINPWYWAPCTINLWIRHQWCSQLSLTITDTCGSHQSWTPRIIPS